MASPVVFSDDQFPVEHQIQQEFKDAHERGGVAAVFACVEKANEEYKSVEINIAVLGEMKAGKSTFINSLRGLNADDDGAAKVDVVQATMEPKGYPHPSNSKIIFWDLPGAGSSEFPAANYLKQMKVERYDFFLLVTDTAFKEIYRDIALCIKAMNKGMIFVRTKVDVAVSGDKLAHRKTHSEQQVLTKIRAEISERLNDADLSSKVFLINNYNKDDYDYPDLLDCLLTDFSKEKRNALILSLNALNDRMIDKKVEIISKDIPMLLIATGFAAFLPILGVSALLDLRIIKMAVKSFTEKMGLDTTSIERLITEYPEREAELRTVIKESDISQFNSFQGLTEFIKTISPCDNRPSPLMMTEAKEVFRLIPVVGWLAASGLSVVRTRQILWAVLKKLQFTAKRTLRAATGTILDAPLEEALFGVPNFVIEPIPQGSYRVD